MAPFLPILSLNGQQQVRLGRGPGAAVPQSLNLGDTLTKAQSGKLLYLYYANLATPEVRRDIQRHSAIGALIPMGAPSLTVWNDLFTSGLAVTGGSGFTLNVAAGTVQSRFFGGQLSVSSITGLAVNAPSVTDRVDTVVIDALGVVSVVAGVPAAATAVYEVDSVSASSGSATLVLTFTYNGFNYTTGTISAAATASAVASAVEAATGGPALPTTLTGTGGPLGTGAVTLTASGALEGPITNQRVKTVSTGTATFTQTTAGSGASPVAFSGGLLPIAQVYIPSTATSSSNYVITSVAQTS